MKSKFNKFVLCAALPIIAAVSLNSCVNEEYSHDKDLDMEIVILKDVNFPVGSIDKIYVDDVISINDGDQMISSDVNGDYVFKFTGTQPFAANFTVPSFSIPFEDDFKADEHQIAVSTGSLAGQTPSVNKQLRLENQRVEKIIKVDESYLLPYQIVDVKSVETATVVKYNFFTNEGAIYLAKDFQMDFPDWFGIEKHDNSADYILENQGNNKNVLRFLNDVKIVAGDTYTLDLIIKTIELPEGCVVDGGNDSQGHPCKKIIISDEDENNLIIAEGDVFIETKDFPIVPDKAELKMQIECADFVVNSANLLLDMTIDVPDQMVPITAYPDFFKTEGVVIDLYNPQISFVADNQLPVDLVFNADLNAYKNSEPSLSAHIGDASENGTGKFLIPSTSSSKFEFSALGDGQNVVKLPLLRDIIKLLPESISVTGINVSTTDKYADIYPGQTFSCSLDYLFYAPLAFGPDFRLAYTMDIEASLEEFGLKTASMMMQVENTIPLNFGVEAQALDAEGNPIESITVQIDGNIPAGIISSPGHNAVKMTLSTSEEYVEFNSLKLKFIATASTSEYQGIPLNKNQYIKIGSVSLSLPDGVNLDLNK